MFITRMMDVTGRRSVKQRLEDIWDGLDRIQRYSRGLSMLELKEYLLIQDAIIWRLMVLNEATLQIPTAFKQQYSQIDWDRFQNLPDELVLGQFKGLAVLKSFRVIESEIPLWKQQIADIIQQ